MSEGDAKKQPVGRLAQVSGKAVSINAAQHYDGWAQSYDDDLLNEYGYCAHQIAVGRFVEIAPNRAADILDVGCGTGLVGQELARAGYRTIDGVDISAGMLAEAAKTGLYRTLERRDMTATADAPPRHDAVICVGSFGAGHLGPSALGGLIDLARPGGAIVVFMNAEPFVDDDYPAMLRALEEAGRWRVAAVEDHNYMSALDRPGKLIVATRAPADAAPGVGA